MDMDVWAALMDLRPKQRLAMLRTLTPREDRVIQLYYGIDKAGRSFGKRKSWHELADHFAVTKDRMIQIINKAERKLRRKDRLNVTYKVDWSEV